MGRLEISGSLLELLLEPVPEVFCLQLGGGESRRDSTGGQPVDGSEDVIGGDSIVVDFPGL